MPALAVIEAILADDALDDEASEDSKCERIEQLIPELSWEQVSESILGVMESDRRMKDYAVVAQVVWGAVLDKRPLPTDRVIALLYHRFDPRCDAEDNLVWSITSKLKQVDYLSDYQPLQDPAVQAELAAVRAG